MASFPHAALCAVVAATFWSLLGYAFGRRFLPRVLAIGMAPVLGWAIQSSIALPIFFLIGFSPTAVRVAGALCVVAAGASLMVSPPKQGVAQTPTIPLWMYAAPALLALVPAAAVFPKFAGNAVYVAAPIFDHSKIALVDAMARQGLPPINPVYGAPGAPSHVAYYYLWHFSAAELAMLLGASGWEADIGLTWFTALASLTLMMALAVYLAEDWRAAILVVILAAAGSLRAGLGWLSGAEELAPFMRRSIGFDGWLFQSAWVPQHLLAASCAVTAMLLIVRYAQQAGILILLSIALVVAAGFESSTYVGGVTFAIAALAATPVLFVTTDRDRRVRFFAGMAVAAVVVACFISPFVIDQLAAVAARHDPTPVVFRPFAVLGDLFPRHLRHILDLPAYWLIELPVQFPAAYLAGAVAIWTMMRSEMSRDGKIVIAVLACLAGAGLVTSWLFASTLGNVNDLALRAVLPAILVLIAVTAAGIVRSPYRVLVGVIALAGLVLGLPDTATLIHSDFSGNSVRDGKIFAQTPELWAAVRRVTPPTARVANDPLFLKDLTPWPVNLSWALLADRSSCFAGREMAIAFAPLPASRRQEINRQFIRVFDGKGTAADVSELATKYGCDAIVLIPQDGAWDNDPFASNPDYRLAESRQGRWRIYVNTTATPR